MFDIVVFNCTRIYGGDCGCNAHGFLLYISLMKLDAWSVFHMFSFVENGNRWWDRVQGRDIQGGIYINHEGMNKQVQYLELTIRSSRDYMRYYGLLSRSELDAAWSSSGNIYSTPTCTVRG